MKLQNWKNFTEADVKLQRRAFLVGPNASGKSNFLDAARFLHDIAAPGGGLENAVLSRGGVKKLRSLAARRRSDVELTVELSETEDEALSWSYTVGFRQEGSGARRTVVTREVVTKDGVEILSRPNREDLEDSARLTQTHLEQISANKDFRDLSSFFATLSYVHIVPQIIRQPDLFFNVSVRPGEDVYGFHFLEAISKTPKKTLNARLRKIEHALRIAVPQLRDLSQTRDDSGVPHLEALYEHWRPNAGRQQENDFSDGTIRLIGLLWAVLETTSLLLLEEPELSLHPAIVREIPSMFYRLNRTKKRQIQILVSTHSPDLLADRSISAEELIMFIPETEGTRLRPAVDIPEVRTLLQTGMSPGDVVIPRSSPRDISQISLFE